MLNSEQRQERDLAAIQTSLLEIEQEIAAFKDKIINAKMESIRCDFELKILKERKSALQSVLKSLSQF